MKGIQKPLPVVVLALIVVLMIVGITRIGGCRKRAQARRPLERPFWCETCQKEFMAGVRGVRAVCPTCHKETSIMRYYYVCKKCGERFLAYDVDTSVPVARLPGGDWDVSVYDLPTPFKCPKCGSDETALEKYEHR
jgi:Zn finger protein HypA/HybF involved in hydrogenase expression